MGKLVAVYEVKTDRLSMAAIKAAFIRIAMDEEKEELRKLRRMYNRSYKKLMKREV